MPNTLFISYSRKQQDKAIQIDKVRLNQFYWWMDYRIVGTVDWWKNICEAVEESYCMVALMSRTYTESVYCMGELQYALKLNKPILCLMLEPDVAYPAELSEKRIQYINLYEWDVNRVIQTILEGMHWVERDYNDKAYHKDVSKRPYLRPPVPTPPTVTASEEDREIAQKVHQAQAAPPRPVRVGEAIIKATKALDDKDYDGVIDLLEPVRPHAKDTDLEIIAELLREARLAQDYAKIASVVKSTNLRLRGLGCQQYAAFRELYSDYPDEKYLSSICPPPPSTDSPLPAQRLGEGRGVRAILPAPFDWINIPAGKVKLGGNSGANGGYIKQATTFDVLAFAIAKYPTTHAQFAKFVEAGGYKQKKWWTDAGWDALEKGYDWDNKSSSFKHTGKAWTEPRFWTDEEWNGATQPVVGVSWYEAMAFCSWLTETSGEPILLPTDQQWQRAAQGDDGRVYPWGNDWDCTRCNNSVEPCDSSVTTPVTQYEGKGDSPCGVVDLAGNVWEWCLTEYETGHNGINGTNLRVLRGGSWDNANTYFFCADYRNGLIPSFRDDDGGFRLSRS